MHVDSKDSKLESKLPSATPEEIAAANTALDAIKSARDIKSLGAALNALRAHGKALTTNPMKDPALAKYLTEVKQGKRSDIISTEIDVGAQVQLLYTNLHQALRTLLLKVFGGFKVGIGGRIKGELSPEVVREIFEEFLEKLEDFLKDPDNHNMIAEYKLPIGRVVVGNEQTQLQGNQVLLNRDKLLSAFVSMAALMQAVDKGEFSVTPVTFTDSEDEDFLKTPRLYVLVKVRVLLDGLIKEHELDEVISNFNAAAQLIFDSFKPCADRIKELRAGVQTEANLAELAKLLPFTKGLAIYTEACALSSVDPSYDLELAAKAKVFQRLLIAENKLSENATPDDIKFREEEASSIARKGLAFKDGAQRGAALKDIWKAQPDAVAKRADELEGDAKAYAQIQRDFQHYKDQLIDSCARAEREIKADGVSDPKKHVDYYQKIGKKGEPRVKGKPRTIDLYNESGELIRGLKLDPPDNANGYAHLPAFKASVDERVRVLNAIHACTESSDDQRSRPEDNGGNKPSNTPAP